MSIAGCHINDSTTLALLNHHPRRLLAQDKYGFEIDIHCAVPIRSCMFEKRLGNRNPRIVDKDVDFA